jgi:outer membrane protein OmpA-like peptidoglycan-associated protein
MVLGLLASKVRGNGAASVTGLTNLLMDQRDSFFNAVPAGVMSLVEPFPQVEAFEPARGKAAAGSEYAGVATAARRRWVWPLVGVAALALIWSAATHRGTQAATGPAFDSSAVARTGAAVKAAAGDVTSKLGAFTKRVLPGGAEVNVPEFGIESKLAAFIEDSTRAVNDTTWFDFDRLTFATGSAEILPQSQEQLQNIATVLEAFPNVNVKIGGYTDNVGDPASNMRLSQQRADAVMRALVGKGIATGRMAAEGYGEQHPVGDNNTEEGRAMNRRIALRVTKK